MAYLHQRQVRDPTFQYEVIVVNDGSPDKTADEALKFVREHGTNKIRLLDLAKNRGKGGAVRMVRETHPSMCVCDCVGMCVCYVPMYVCRGR